MRCDDLEAKAADDLRVLSLALAKAPVIEEVSYDSWLDALSSARLAAAPKAVTREVVPPKPVFLAPVLFLLAEANAPGRASE